MRSIQRRFIATEEKHPYLGDYIILYKTILKQGFSKRVIAHAFHTLVPENDYDQNDIKQLLAILYQATNKL